LISKDTINIINLGGNIKELHALPFPGIDTLLKALRRSVEKGPNNDFLGTRVKDHYEWMTYREVHDMAEDYGYGMNALNLAPQTDAEGTKWRIVGIQSKNCKEWLITHFANMS
jgi:long-subunit acyl-CoA synthetase (AMP-forming)